MTSERRFEWLVPGMLMLLSLVPAVAGVHRVGQLAAGAAITSENARFFAMPLPVVLHVCSVIPFSVLGALQFAPAFRHRRRALHRALGQVVAVCGLMAALSGLWMTFAYPWPAGDGEVVYGLRIVFGSAMAISIALAVDAVRRRDFMAHGEWMMRGYAIGMGAGTQVITHLPWFILVGQTNEVTRAIAMGAGWVINLAVAESVIRRSRSAALPDAKLSRRADRPTRAVTNAG